VRRAVVWLSIRAGAFPRWVVLDVVDHDQVQPAVTVIVEEGCRGGPKWVVQARLLRHLCESAVAVVEEQPHAGILGNENVREAVVIDVADGHAHAVAGYVQPRAFADVLKPSSRELPEQAVGLAMRPTVVKQVDVEQTVAIEVEDSSARADD